MSSIKQLIGKVKDNPSEGWQGASGLTLMVVQIEGNKELLVIRPINFEEMELFYRLSYEESMKDMISDDYDYCIWYALDDDGCELTCCINMIDLENIRETTTEDIQEHNRNLEEFKKFHKVYEYQEKIEKEEKEDEVALQEFKNEEKSKFSVRTTKDNETIDAVIYKGFAIHNNLNDIGDNPYKTISIISGEFNGIKLTNCSIRNCKKLIDEIRGVIGDRDLETSNEEIKKIINIYN